MAFGMTSGCCYQPHSPKRYKINLSNNICERCRWHIKVNNVIMAEKTPVSTLQELCVKYKNGGPMFEEIPDEVEDGKTFACIVQAFGSTAKGTGRSKREAKHTASANLLS